MNSFSLLLLLSKSLLLRRLVLLLLLLLVLLLLITEQEQVSITQTEGACQSSVASLRVTGTPVGETALDASGRTSPTARTFGSQRPTPKRLPNAGIPGVLRHTGAQLGAGVTDTSAMSSTDAVCVHVCACVRLCVWSRVSQQALAKSLPKRSQPTAWGSRDNTRVNFVLN